MTTPPNSREPQTLATRRRAQTQLARLALAEKHHATPEAKHAYFSRMGTSAAATRCMLSGAEVAALVSAYRALEVGHLILESIVHKHRLPDPPLSSGDGDPEE